MSFISTRYLVLGGQRVNLQATKLFIVTPATKGVVTTTPWISC